ncbi:MAG: hypothetical protein ABIV21_07885 [Pyrinomonadaceae bacterium]
MLGKNTIRKSITLFTVAAVWCVYSMVAFALPKDATAEITVSGQVMVNGQAVVSNTTILSGAVITTAAGSSAVVSLGKLGRVEILEDSSLTLRFSENSIIGVLDQGKARVANSAGVATTITTKNATVIADAGQDDNFMVEVECSHTHVDTTAGVVTMREGSNDKQVVAGTSATAGNLVQTGCKPCLRPNSAPETAVAGLPWLILVAAGIAGVGIFLGLGSGNTTLNGGAIIVSPTR